jgi:hypothetical protein
MMSFEIIYVVLQRAFNLNAPLTLLVEGDLQLLPPTSPHKKCNINPVNVITAYTVTEQLVET